MVAQEILCVFSPVLALESLAGAFVWLDPVGSQQGEGVLVMQSVGVRSLRAQSSAESRS